MIIAVEGVSCTGKSTLASELARHFGWQVVDCYYHVADDPTVLGEPVARFKDALLAALDAHLLIEAERQRQAAIAVDRDGGVVMDRSIDTLLAHVRAVGRLRGFDVTAAARTMVSESVRAGTAVVPDVTLLLTAASDTLALRARTRPGLPAVYYDPRFSEHFNEHFTDPMTARCLPIGADAPAPAVLATALRLLPNSVWR